jgi:ABC-type transport system involved in multi-copper enzyme maturation permease subunit
MYFWKCWRESRGTFIVGVVVTVVLCGLSTIYAAKIGVPALDHAGAHPTNPTAAQVWVYVVMGNLGAFGGLMALLWGLVLGSKGLGKEFEDKTADFLFTRPRRRRYWVWAGWPAGVLQLAIIVFAAGAVTCGMLVLVTGQFYTWRLMATLPCLVVASVAAYGFTYLLTIVTRSGRQALSYGIFVLIIAIAIPAVAGHYWHIHMPHPMGFMGGAAEWAAGPLHLVPFEGGVRWTDVGPLHPFPFEAAVLWTVVALVFPLVSQLVVEKAQV